MVLTGTIVNAICIVAGTLLGRILKNIPEAMKQTVMNGIGLAVVVLGVQMGLKSQQYLIVILSLVLGAVIGEWMGLEEKLNTLGKWIEKKMKAKEESSISQGFVTATLIFLIGAMAIIGALDSGIRHDHDVLFTKSIIDGFTAVILASTLGIGVIFSAVPILLYQGGIALFATQIDKWVPAELMDFFIVEMTATGGVMIFAIGLNMMGLTRIRVANLLPGILVTTFLTALFYYFNIPL
jgi:uncharacterized protein